MEGRQTNRSTEAVVGSLKEQAGEKLISWKHTYAGASDAITFAGLGYPNMADADYRVMVCGESTASAGDAVYADESTITKYGFTLIGGTAAEIGHVFVHGNSEE